MVESNDTDSYDSNVTVAVREFMGINRVSFTWFIIHYRLKQNWFFRVLDVILLYELFSAVGNMN